MESSYDRALAYADRWMGLIHKTSLSEDDAKIIIEESKQNFAEHFIRGWLNYRKSVAEA